VAVPLKLGVKAIKVPYALIFSKKLTPAMKRVWMRLLIDERHPRPRPQTSKKLAKRTGLARSTVVVALECLAAEGWLVPTLDSRTGRRWWRTVCPEGDSRFVRIPVDLIRDVESVRPQEVLCYGFLQAMPTFNGISGEFKWAELHDFTRLHLRTLKRAVRRLAAAFWIHIEQQNRLAPIQYRLQHADFARRNEVRKRLEARLSRHGEEYVGEAIMHEELGLIVATDQCVERARPDFLVNPETRERLELDRFYPIDRVAFEFNGSQHYVATGRFSKEGVAAQKKRDAIKREYCKRNGIELVVIRAEDLAFTRMLRKVGDLLPRRPLRTFKRTIRYLNRLAAGYLEAALAGQSEEAKVGRGDPQRRGQARPHGLGRRGRRDEWVRSSIRTAAAAT